MICIDARHGKRPASCGLVTMESGNGVLCRTGRVVEANIELLWWTSRDRSCERAWSDCEILRRSKIYVRSKAPGAVRIGLDRTDVHVALD